jgi:hypothetical protein
MSSGVKIDTEALRAAGTALNLVGDELDSFLKDLESDLMSLGEPWGTDEIGQLISQAYKEVVAFAFDCLRDVLNDIRKSGVDLQGMAQRYEEAERQFTEQFNSYFEWLRS